MMHAYALDYNGVDGHSAMYVLKVMSVSRLKKSYWSDRCNTLKSFEIGSSCIDTSFPARFPGVDDGVTVGLLQNVL